MSDKPLTLAELRAHIERRIPECERRRDATRVEFYATSCLAEGARCAYEEILALLDRVQPVDKALQMVADAAQEWRKWDDDKARRELVDALDALDLVQEGGSHE